MIKKIAFAGPGRITKDPRRLPYVIGGALLVTSGYIHLRLWSSFGYRHIPTVGTLFVVQAIVGALLGLALIVAPRVWLGVLGAGFAAATIAGFVASLTYGVFGFRDYWSAPFAVTAFVVELLALAFTMTAVALTVARARTDI